jgi:hypothetical protein
VSPGLRIGRQVRQGPRPFGHADRPNRPAADREARAISVHGPRLSRKRKAPAVVLHPQTDAVFMANAGRASVARECLMTLLTLARSVKVDFGLFR